MPELVVDCESLPVALLSKTYVKDGLSQVERYHAKCGDVGIKYLKRAFPSLSIPKNFRCEFCIEVMAPANREDELNISLESASIQTTLAPTLDPMVVLATRNCLWTGDLVSYGHFA